LEKADSRIVTHTLRGGSARVARKAALRHKEALTEVLKDHDLFRGFRKRFVCRTEHAALGSEGVSAVRNPGNTL